MLFCSVPQDEELTFFGLCFLSPVLHEELPERSPDRQQVDPVTLEEVVDIFPGVFCLLAHRVTVRYYLRLPLFESTLD